MQYNYHTNDNNNTCNNYSVHSTSISIIERQVHFTTIENIIYDLQGLPQRMRLQRRISNCEPKRRGTKSDHQPTNEQHLYSCAGWSPLKSHF